MSPARGRGSKTGETGDTGKASRLREEYRSLKEANEALLRSALDAQSRAESSDKALAELSQAAKLDPLTGLPDRLYLLDRFEHAMAQARRNDTRVAVLFVDLDGFKHINDRLGHAVGDQVLQWAARGITSAVREVDTVSRHGGDEFVIVLDGVSDAESAAVVANKIIAELGQECCAGEHRVRVSASIGISLFPDHGEDASKLIEQADAAMYQAKRGGLGDFSVHGDAPPHNPGQAPAPTVVKAGHEMGQLHLQEANSQLVLAALDAKELLTACELAQKRQTAFMGVLAHELRSPLTPIRIAVGMLGQTGDDEVLLAQLKSVIDSQITRMGTLIGDLLEVSRMHSGKLRLSWQRMDLADVIEGVVESTRLTTSEQQQELSLEIPQHALQIRGDPGRLAQVFGNLLDNAAKYTPHGGRIDVSVQAGVEFATVVIEDSGIGITAETLPTIFEPFVQDTHAVGFSRSGLGIGLTVVRELVLAHGGSITASSDGAGCGSRFVLTLPLLATERTAPPTSQPAGEGPSSCGDQGDQRSST